MRRVTPILLVVATVWLVVASGAIAQAHTVGAASDGPMLTIDRWQVSGTLLPTLARTPASLGRRRLSYASRGPEGRMRDRVSCIADYRNGASLWFTTLGGFPGKRRGCAAPHFMFLADAVFTSSRWSTDRALRVGDHLGRVRGLYPELGDSHRPVYRQLAGRSYWLSSKISPFTEGRVPVLEAIVRRGRVVAFVLTVGAQGE